MFNFLDMCYNVKVIRKRKRRYIFNIDRDFFFCLKLDYFKSWKLDMYLVGNMFCGEFLG